MDTARSTLGMAIVAPIVTGWRASEVCDLQWHQICSERVSWPSLASLKRSRCLSALISFTFWRFD